MNLDTNTNEKRKEFDKKRESFSGRHIIKFFFKYFIVYGIRGFICIYSDMSTILSLKWIQHKGKHYVIKSKKDIYAYSNWINNLKVDKSQFVNFTDQPHQRKPNEVKIFAFYLPQFYSIPENDMAHGKGFTEWNNVASCIPQFIGHYQPKIPYDLGFYNPTLPGTMERQSEIAKAYGIYGFCFYFYWFNGKRLLEKPLEYFQKSKIDFHYHFCWANENWSKLWDGGNNEIIVNQPTDHIDADCFFNDLLPFFNDSRYEKINGKPILVIYKPLMYDKEKFKLFISNINELARANGFPGIYLLGTNVGSFNKTKEYNLDGIVEFPPHNIDVPKVVKRRIIKTTNFDIHNMDEYIAKERHLQLWGDGELFKSCFPCWDNTPRKLYTYGKCFILSDESFKKWLTGIIQWTKQTNTPDKQYIYINAWNEWGEGAMLEPTTRYGYKYLNIVKNCLESLYGK